MQQVFFKIGNSKLEAELNESTTSEEIIKTLPVHSKINRWGDEIYFSIDLDLPPENATLDVDISDIAYWPEGKSLCIFFGPTPISTSNKPIPAAKVNIIGKITSGIESLKTIESGIDITIEKT